MADGGWRMAELGRTESDGMDRMVRIMKERNLLILPILLILSGRLFTDPPSAIRHPSSAIPLRVLEVELG
jgi:hypothetical protein